MPLDEEAIAAAGRIGALEEMVEADLVERRGRGVGRNMPAVMAASDHGHGVPAEQAFDFAFQFAVAGELRLLVGRDGVDVGRVEAGRCADTVAKCRQLHLREQIAGAFRAVANLLNKPHLQIAR